MNKDDLFTRIYQNYYNDVYRLIYSYALNQEDTKDLLQQTFFKLYKNKHKFSIVDENAKKWLFRVAINLTKNHLDSSWKKKHIIKDNLENYSHYENQSDLLYFLKNLPSKYRITLYLYYYEGYSINELSKLLKISESAIKLRLKRGKEKLKLEMERENL